MQFKFAHVHFFLYLCAQNCCVRMYRCIYTCEYKSHYQKRKENTMLGMRESNSPITGQAARDIRMQMWRIASGHQNEFDHQMAGSLNKANTEKRYSVEWRD